MRPSAALAPPKGGQPRGASLDPLILNLVMVAPMVVVPGGLLNHLLKLEALPRPLAGLEGRGRRNVGVALAGEAVEPAHSGFDPIL